MGPKASGLKSTTILSHRNVNIIAVKAYLHTISVVI